MTTKPTALLLDVDGTLPDTVHLHVHAWWLAFEENGHRVSAVDVHRAIGRGSEDLVETLLGEPDDAVVARQTTHWGELRDRCHPFHQVPELVREVAGRGVRVVLVTSGSADDTRIFREELGCDDVLHAVVSSGDVENAEPAPDIVLAALAAAGCACEDAVMVGDTVHDVRAAAAAGVACIGVLAGGIGDSPVAPLVSDEQGLRG